MVRCGLVWCGMEGHGVVLRDAAWCAVLCCAVEWCGVGLHVVVWCGVV